MRVPDLTWRRHRSLRGQALADYAGLCRELERKHAARKSASSAGGVLARHWHGTDAAQFPHPAGSCPGRGHRPHHSRYRRKECCSREHPAGRPCRPRRARGLPPDVGGHARRRNAGRSGRCLPHAVGMEIVATTSTARAPISFSMFVARLRRPGRKISQATRRCGGFRSTIARHWIRRATSTQIMRAFQWRSRRQYALTDAKIPPLGAPRRCPVRRARWHSRALHGGATFSALCHAHSGCWLHRSGQPLELYIQVVTFDASGPVADAVLASSQSADPASPFFADQTWLYSRKQWLRLPFSHRDVARAAIGPKTVLQIERDGGATPSLARIPHSRGRQSSAIARETISRASAICRPNSNPIRTAK